ncbi:hypothetical protein B566_EDAN013482 [Ephemera danica]|nr:hypothetical protein B566_EDAN013482 [Ephemera danica]
MIGFYVFHILIQLTKELVARDICVGIDVMWMYCALSSYFWLQVMTYDIWKSFRRIGTAHKTDSRFKYYFAYASGTPTLILMLAIWFEFSDLIPVKLSLYCIRKYWTILFFGIPALLILISNVYFFISTFLKIRRADRETQEIINNEDSKIHNKKEKKRFKTYLRLFIITGGAWCLSIISTLILFIWNKIQPLDQRTSNHVSSVIVSTTNLQSVGIFVTCVCLTHLRQILLQRLWPNKHQYKINQVSPATTSTSGGGTDQCNL